MKAQSAALRNSKNVYKSIRLRKQNPNQASKIAEKYKLSPIAANILAARGFTLKDLAVYLSPTLKDGLPAPDGLKNLDKACEIISDVCEEKGSIAICCDFDVDGLSGGSQLHHFLTSIGVPNKVFVPDRFEDGYGLNEKMIKKIAADGYKAVVCIDYGTTNIHELSLAKKLGLKTIVIDHHHVGETLPPCDAFINPNQKDCNFAGAILCASGLTWYFLLGLRRCLKQAKDLDIKTYLDLACLGTICDMVPLIGTNRIIAKRGLELLTKTSRIGLQSLKNVAGLNNAVQCSHVSFGIGPRLNAAGRIVHGEVVVELLTTNDSTKAAKLAEQLNRINLERQEIEQRVKEKAVYLVNCLECLPYGIVVHDREFHTGVVGIVAQRLVEQFYRPAVVLGMDEDGVYKGSVRGIKGFSVVEALSAVSGYLIKYGGHEGAGGLSVKAEKIDSFSLAFAEECEKRLEKIEVNPYVEADCGIFLSDLTIDLVRELKSFAPFGVGNPNPVVAVHNLRVKDVRVLKNSHLKVTFADGKRSLTGFLWKQTEHPELFTGNKVNIAFRPEENTYNGLTEIQANIQAVERA